MRSETELNFLRLEQVDADLYRYASLLGCTRPRRGWLRHVRETLGRTERQQAQRLGISGSTLHKAEQSEADERISVAQLRRLADGLDCDLVCVIVPRRPLSAVVRERAQAIATAEVEKIAHSMRLEGQPPPPDRLRVQIARRADELLRGRWSALWR